MTSTFGMFYDWFKGEQDFPNVDIPQISKHGYFYYNLETGETERAGQAPYKHEGSFSTIISVAVRGSTISVDGNIGRFDRIDNFFGYTSLDQLVAAANRFLKTLHPDMPQFTKGTQRLHRQSDCGSKVSVVSDGLTFKRLDLCTNASVGEGMVGDYLKALATQPYRNSVPNLFSNGKTTDWKSKDNNANLIYASVYDKEHDLKTKTLPLAKRKFGEGSKEYLFVERLIEHARKQGVARFEQKLKSRYLQKNDLAFYGLFDESQLWDLQKQFLNIDSRLQVESMELETISEQLLSNHIVSSTHAANSTAMYALNWASGKTFDLAKSQVKTHRARLRKIGIDIAMPCDLSKFTPVKVVSSQIIERKSLDIPDWYELPTAKNHLRLVA